MKEKEHIIWMPYEEYVAVNKLMKEQKEETINKVSYFFWNNFSMKGYDDFKVSLIDKNLRIAEEEYD